MSRKKKKEKKNVNTSFLKYKNNNDNIRIWSTLRKCRPKMHKRTLWSTYRIIISNSNGIEHSRALVVVFNNTSSDIEAHYTQTTLAAMMFNSNLGGPYYLWCLVVI